MATDKIDKQATSDSLFGKIKQQSHEREKLNPVSVARPTHERPTENIEQDLTKLDPQSQEYEKISIELTIPQREGLARIARQIMRNRPKRYQQVTPRERITGSVLMRALIDIFLEEGQFTSFPVIHSEEDAKVWIKKMLLNK